MVRVETLSRTYGRVPPARTGIGLRVTSGRVRVCSEAVADKDCVAACGIQCSVRFVRYLYFVKLSSPPEAAVARGGTWFSLQLSFNRITIIMGQAPDWCQVQAGALP
jgi:hypothetical protein